ncbi:MAG: hypothetical protein ABSH04_01310 [Acidimicrobiales bacterium]
MHPIERLRFVARTGWAGPSVLAAEAAWALADLAEREAPALVPACRRLLDRQPGCGPLWWLAARVLSAGEPVSEAQRCARELENDPTPTLMLEALPPGARAVRQGGIGEVVGADLVVVEVGALGPSGMVADASCSGLLDAAHAAEVPVWVEAGVGRVLPTALWESMSGRFGAPHAQSRPGALPGVRTPNVRIPATRGHSTLFGHRGIEQVVGPNGAQSLAIALSGSDCPEPPELLEGF